VIKMVENLVEILKGAWRVLDKPEYVYAHYITRTDPRGKERSICAQVKHKLPLEIVIQEVPNYSSCYYCELITVGNVWMPKLPNQLRFGDIRDKKTSFYGIDMENDFVIFAFGLGTGRDYFGYTLRLKDVNRNKERSYKHGISKWYTKQIIPVVKKFNTGEIYIADNGDVKSADEEFNFDIIRGKKDNKYWISGDKRIRVPTIKEAEIITKKLGKKTRA